MRTYIIRRLIHSALTMLGITLFTFVLLRMVPGDPAQLILPENASQAEIIHMRRLLGLDEPLYTQYYLYVRDLVRADFGTSFQYNVPAIELVLERLPQTIRLSLSAMAVTVKGSAPPAAQPNGPRWWDTCPGNGAWGGIHPCPLPA